MRDRWRDANARAARRQKRREWLLRWCDEPLSDANKDYRREAIAVAFGLHVEYVERLVSRGKWPYMWEASIGEGLLREILYWCADHPNCSLNDKPSDVTFWATVALDG